MAYNEEYNKFLSAEEKANNGEELTQEELECLAFWCNANYQ